MKSSGNKEVDKIADSEFAVAANRDLVYSKWTNPKSKITKGISGDLAEGNEERMFSMLLINYDEGMGVESSGYINVGYKTTKMGSPSGANWQKLIEVINSKDNRLENIN